MQHPRPPLFVPPFPPARGILRPPRFFPQPPRAYFISSVPRPPRPAVVDSERIWLDTFKQTHCQSSESIASNSKEPPLRILRRRIVQAQKLVEQLTKEATELATIENKLKMLHEGSSNDETLQLRVHYQRKVGVCETLKKQLEAMNATSGLFPKQQLKEIEDFSRRVNKKKAYRKRSKLQRRSNAKLYRALYARKDEQQVKIDNVVESKPDEENQEKKDNSLPSLSTKIQHSPDQSLDPETLTFDRLIAVRRAWDAYNVYPQTPGASRIPPHFVPPPPAPSPQWAVYIDSPVSSNFNYN